MSEEDKKRQAKDNTGLEPKPEGVAEHGAAPKGHLGHQPSTFSPAPGGSVQSRQSGVSEAQSQQQKQPTEDKRPIAVKTGVAEIDQQSEERGQRLMTEDEIAAEARRLEQGGDRPNIPQSEYAKMFQQAHDQAYERQKSIDKTKENDQGY